jgi:predicted acyl esterase
MRATATFSEECRRASTRIVLALASILANTSGALADDSPGMPRVRVSDDGKRFVLADSGQSFTPWGFNYLGEFGHLIEESWDKDWPRLERDFREMRKLGANVVRIHLQFGTYMKGPNEFDRVQFDRLRKLLDLARNVGVYVDVTGLCCYRLKQIPDWYDKLDEQERWHIQARWWKEIAKTCANHSAVFCYDLMNEPVIGGPAKEGEPRWVGGELGGFYFVQRISDDAKGRTNTEIAAAWSEKLTTAIREEDPETLITVGVIPWAQIWPTAKPVFYSPEAAKHFDFVSPHIYPGKDELGKAFHALTVYDIGKPIVVEEIFPLACSLEELNRFVDGSRDRADGWISHYFGHTIEEHRKGAEPKGTAPDAPFHVAVADFLTWWSHKGKEIAGRVAPEAEDNNQGAAPRRSNELIVRGSVEQIHIIHAKPGEAITIDGPGDLKVTKTADSSGGLVVRELVPGAYRVLFAGRDRPPETVRVMTRDEHPDRSFYALQKLEPTRGYIETRDGTLLCYRVVLPDPKVHGKGPYDLIITYSGYQPGLETSDAHQNKPFDQFSKLGYAVAGVNMRGSGCSGGAFDLMEPITWLDGYDVVEAFSAQPWVDDVALGDQSWPGLTQLYVAGTQPPSLDAIVAGSVVGDFYRDVFYPGGIPNVGFGHIWAGGRDVENAWPARRKEINSLVTTDRIAAANQALRGQNVNTVETIKTQPFDGPHWQSRSAEQLVGRIEVPTLQIVSWQDPQCGGRPAALFERFPKTTPVRLVGVNGFHQYYAGAVWNEIVEFLDIYLGDHAAGKIAAYESKDRFVALLESNAKGDVRGRFTLPAFKSSGDGQRFELGRDLKADDPHAATGISTFNYAPSRPGSWTAPTQDQRTFTSDALKKRNVMAGPGSVDLWINTEAEDVDLQVTLSEVRPDGHEMLVQSGWLRASHRSLDENASTPLRPIQLHTTDASKKLTPRQWTPLRIELFPFAHVFREGSRIRLTISGPGGAGNAWPWAFEALPGGFDVRISHGGDRKSSVVLPVVEPNQAEIPASLPAPDDVWLQPCRPAARARA